MSELRRSVPLVRSQPLKAKRGTEERACKTCGKTFVFYLSQLNAYKGGGQFCSRTCSYAGIRARSAGRPIKDKYGREQSAAHKEWKRAVRERDDYTCRRCGKYDLHIHAHHIASRARRPDLRYDVDNGMCLDGSCHQWVHHHPIEAEVLGFLSDAKYEMRHLEQRRFRAAKARVLDIDESEVVRLHNEGVRATAIGRLFGCTKGPVLRILKEHGCQPHPCGNPNRRAS